MQTLNNKRIVLGVTGSIAAYKSAELVRRLRSAGAQVRSVLTAGGAKFVTPLTLQSLSGHAVHQELLDTDTEANFGHIELARWADAILIAPASANFLARLTHGYADDLLTALCLATTAPIAVAPAMNHRMWANAATQDNMKLLAQRRVYQFGPGAGDQACGEVGAGRMAEPDELVDMLNELFQPGVLQGLKVLITAGPTQEALDPVRFLSNRSSGKMGFALARAALEAGAQVILVSGPSALPNLEGVERLDVCSALQMHDAVLQRVPECDIFIAAAAVADYRPAQAADKKIKKGKERLVIDLIRNPDILASVAKLTKKPFTVGFAAETEDLENNARVKLKNKSLDMIAANIVGGKHGGFEHDDNAITVIWNGGKQELPLASKDSIARQLIALIALQAAPSKKKQK